MNNTGATSSGYGRGAGGARASASGPRTAPAGIILNSTTASSRRGGSGGLCRGRAGLRRPVPRASDASHTAFSDGGSDGTPTLPSLSPPLRSSLSRGGGGGGGAGARRAAPVQDDIPTYDSLYAEHGGASMTPAPMAPRGSDRAGSSSMLACGRGRPGATVQELQRNYTGPARTSKGRAIQKDLDDLADDYFGDEVTRAPPKQDSASAAAGMEEGGTYAKLNAVYMEEAVPRSWRKGPADTAGRTFDASDRNLLCMDVFMPGGTIGAGVPGRGRGAGARGGPVGPLCVVGSADHGLKVFDIAKMTERKSLYTKTAGHTEWVTTCKFLSNGQVISGGMDSKLCLWDSVLTGGPARCQDLLGHTGSISQVDVNEHGIAVSASYDRTVRIWDVNGYGREVGCLTGHKGPVMQFAWSGTQVLSGDRQGTAKVWDLNTATCLATLATKRGQIGALAHMIHADIGHLTMFGDQGGVLTVLDMRQGKRPVHQAEQHPGGVLSGICSVDYRPYIVTCGADRRITVVDPRRSFEEVFEFTDHKDFIYSLKTFGPMVLSGAGNGWLLVHDTITGECCYGLGANQAAVREIFASPDYLVTAGDDGKASVYEYNGLFM